MPEDVEGAELHQTRVVLGQRGAPLVKREPLPLVACADNRDTPNAHALRQSNYHDS